MNITDHMTRGSIHRMFRAFADPTRLRLLHLLQDGEHCVSDIIAVLRAPQAKVSRHLIYLRKAGLVERRRQGLWSFYRLSPASSVFHEKLLECLGECFGAVPGLAADRRRAAKLRASGGCCPGAASPAPARRARVSACKSGCGSGRGKAQLVGRNSRSSWVSPRVRNAASRVWTRGGRRITEASLLLALAACAASLSLTGCAGRLPAPRGGLDVQTMTVRWQRLVDSADETCPRCATTGTEVEKAVAHLRRSLAPAGIEVILETERIDEAAFARAPLESNRIWVAGRSLEEWLGARTASSPCCDACGDAECRTVSVGGLTYEAIPVELIVRAGFLAAAEMLRQAPAAADSVGISGSHR